MPQIPGEGKDDSEIFPQMGVLDAEQISSMESMIGLTIRNPAIYEQALTHRSYLQVVNRDGNRSNERLEYLGDAILGMITAEYLFYSHRDELEGDLTKKRSWLVSKRSLAVCARRLGLESKMLVSYSAQQSLKRGNENMLADCLEALIAAIYVDVGFSAARKFIIDSLFPIIVEESLHQDMNYKSGLLELVQGEGFASPTYVVLQETGPDHDKTFTVEVLVNRERLGTGQGKNKKEAEQRAAKDALDHWQESSLGRDVSHTAGQ